MIFLPTLVSPKLHPELHTTFADGITCMPHEAVVYIDGYDDVLIAKTTHEHSKGCELAEWLRLHPYPHLVFSMVSCLSQYSYSYVLTWLPASRFVYDPTLCVYTLSMNYLLRVGSTWTSWLEEWMISIAPRRDSCGHDALATCMLLTELIP